MLCCAKSAVRLGPLGRELHALLSVFQGLALRISELEIGGAAVAVINLQNRTETPQQR